MNDIERTERIMDFLEGRLSEEESKRFESELLTDEDEVVLSFERFLRYNGFLPTKALALESGQSGVEGYYFSKP